MDAKTVDLSDSVKSAKSLLGWKLVHDSPDGRTAGIIVETEAYHQADEASHTFKGPTKRNRAMYGPAGHAYIYFTYGMHYCFNVVTGEEGQGQGVLIRALEPVEGLELMTQRRGFAVQNDKVVSGLCNGPAKLVQAMGITMQHYGHDLTSGNELYLEPGISPAQISEGPRVGINKAVHRPWRFYITGNKFVSSSKGSRLKPPPIAKSI